MMKDDDFKLLLRGFLSKTDGITDICVAFTAED